MKTKYNIKPVGPGQHMPIIAPSSILSQRFGINWRIAFDRIKSHTPVCDVQSIFLWGSKYMVERIPR